LVAEEDERQSGWVCFQRISACVDDGKNEMLEDVVECGGQTINENGKMSTIFECGNL